MELAIALILTCCFACIGQLLARIYYLKGSKDKIWLMGLSIFPFSIIPTIMMAFGLIHKGDNEQLFDWYVSLPLISIIILPFVLQKLSSVQTINFMFSMILNFTTIYTAYYFHDNTKCINNHALMKTLITMFSLLLSSKLMDYIPFASLGMRIFKTKMNNVFSKIIEVFINVSIFLFAYITCNMIVPC